MLRMFLAATTAALAVWGGASGPTESTPTASATPTPSPTIACPPALPITAMVAGVTTTSVTISYSIFFRPPCGYDPPMTVSLFASREDAQQWRAPVAVAVSGAERNGSVTIDRLTPDTEYWYRFTDVEGRRDPYVIASARTAPLTECRATATIDARWGNGFVATVTVRNTGTQPLDRWRVSWRWSGDERVQSVWGGVAETVGVDVTVRNASYNGALAMDGVTTFGVLVTTSSVPDGLTMGCAR
ncbi:cellulose binding domain-containing protein [Micromonospora sp. WMMD961]|uniref:cellulose binding domain-containing protein n=1 Tax=Micromonospora sp. WMMD961 TaxID=3016100 RepID=UPI002415D7DE|nr:cellulose binding domain-containing protein [Micromonospora sp. WMMD961]MDG4782067.1 cellulose binding domain-containing protein [Micromonospora sp. WMMD961]